MSAPKSDTATIEARKNRLLELLAEGKSQTQAAEILRVEGYPADQRTVRRDVSVMRGQWVEQNMNAMQIWQAEHIAELQELRTKLEDPTIRPAEKIALALAIIREDSKIKGTAAPSKSISTNVNVDGENLGPYRQFVLAVRGLELAQIEQLLVFAREMPRKPYVVIQPPETSPLWGDEPKQLEDGNEAS